jgi:hypothetical protein
MAMSFKDAETLVTAAKDANQVLGISSALGVKQCIVDNEYDPHYNPLVAHA